MPLKHGAEASCSRSKFERLFALCAALWVGACGSGREGPSADASALTIVLPREPDQLDPRFVSDAYGLKLSRLLHASLMRVNGENFEPEPYLAREIVMESPTRYRLELRDGLRFSDGTTLDAEDVVATFRALVDPAVRSRYASTYRRIRSLRAEGPLSVIFDLEAPHATFLTDLEIPVLREEDAFSPPDPARPPVGAGPYRLTARGRGGLDFTENPNFFLGRLAHPRLRFIVVRDDNTRALRMLAGAGDLALNAIPPLLLPLFHAPEFRVRNVAGVGTTYLGLNLQDPALTDVRVRRALAHAIDREALIRYKLGGRAHPAASWIPTGHWAYASDTPRYAYDPERARALLAQAGYTQARPLAFVMRTGSDRFAVSIARALAAMWAQIGVAVEVRPSETATLLSDLARGRFEATFLQVPEVFEPHVLSWFFESNHIPEPGVREGGNRWRMQSPELDALLERGRATTDRAQRVAIYRDVQHLLARELPVIPLWHEDVVAVTSARLRDYRAPRDARFGTLVLPPSAASEVHSTQ